MRIGKVELHRRLENLTAYALARLERIIDKGSDKDALEASKLVMNRTLPEPKVNTAEIARQAALGAGAGASAGLALVTAKASARLLPAPAPVDATFETVSTLSKGGKE